MSSDAHRSPPPSTGAVAPHPDDAPAVVTPAAFAPALLERYGDLFPPPPDLLQKFLDPPPHAAEDELRRAFAERRALYASRTGEQLPKPVRQQNQTLLHRLDDLAPALEAHIVAIRAWRLLAEAAAALEAHHPGRARRRLDEASALLEGRPVDQPLVVWLRDLESDLAQPPAPSSSPPSPAPLLIVPPEVTAVAGEPLECSFVVWPQGTPVAVEDLPEGLALDPARPRIHGTPMRAGETRVTLTAGGPEGGTRAVLTLRIETTPTKLAPAPAPRPLPADRFTVRMAGGRRLHVFAGPAVRLGRAMNSDLCIAVCVRGDPGATKALTGEISRQHAEIFLQENEARVCDGWQSSGACSTFGTYLDTEKVAAAPGTVLRSGQILHLTGHVEGATVPHWRVRVLTSDEAKDAPPPLRDARHGGVAGVWLQRVDALPDDVLLLAGACDLATLDLCSSTLWLGRAADGFLLVTADGQSHPLEALTHLIAGSTLDAPGTVCPHDLREALERSSKT